MGGTRVKVSSLVMLVSFVSLILLSRCSIVPLSADLCNAKPIFRIQGQEVKNVSTVEQEVYFLPQSKEASLICTCACPIQIHFDGLMLWPIKSSGRRDLQPSNCFKLEISLPSDHRVTGNYTCKEIVGGNQSDVASLSIFIFSQGESEVTIMGRIGRSELYSAAPDDARRVRVPCLSTHPSIIPKLKVRNPTLQDDTEEDIPDYVDYQSIDTSVRYKFPSGFTVEQAHPKLFCMLEDDENYPVRILRLKPKMGGYVVRASPRHQMNGIDTDTGLHVQSEELFSLTCESDSEVMIKFESVEEVSGWSSRIRTRENESIVVQVERNEGSYYSHKATLSGSVAVSSYYKEFYATCYANLSRTELYKWVITVIERDFTSGFTGSEHGSGIYYIKKASSIACFGARPRAVLLSCLDPSSCEMAENVLDKALVYETTLDPELLPWKITLDRDCSDLGYSSNTGCKLFQDKDLSSFNFRTPGSMEIIKCLETIESEKRYSRTKEPTKYRLHVQKYFIGLDGTILHPRDVTGDGRSNHHVLKMNIPGHSPGKLYYVNQDVEIRCEAARSVFMSGLRIVFLLNNTGNTSIIIPGANGSMMVPEEEIVNGTISIRTSLKIPDRTTIQIGCLAPLWKSNGFMNTTKSIQVLDSKPITLNGSEHEVTLHLHETNISLECIGKGQPRPTISWYKDGNPLLENSTLLMAIITSGDSTVSRIIFSNITKSHHGEYKCIAQNIIGQESRSFRVTVVQTQDKAVLVISTTATSVVILLFLGGLIGFLYWRKLYAKMVRLRNLTAEEVDKFLSGDPTLLNPKLCVTEQLHLLPYDKTYEFPRSRLKLEKLLGSGEFGSVFQATAEGLYDFEDYTTVAVKTVKPNSDGVHLLALLNEIKLMIYIGKHVNVLGILGASTELLARRELYVLLEYCKQGSLSSYLYKWKDSFRIGFDETSLSFPEQRDSVKRGPSLQTLYNFAYQAAKGMEYLESKKVIHGDLAARNILITESNIIKVADFGLARQLYQDQVYMKKTRCPLPIKWMALESLESMEFSSKSDVWSFGVLLWEMFSLGETPYPGVEVNQDFRGQLAKGLRLHRPKHATVKVYEMMRSCWEREPSQRPSFTALQEFFSQCIDSPHCEIVYV